VKTLWESNARQEISKRIDLLTPDTSGLWGRMNARQMMAHLVDGLRMATGELATQEKKLPIRFTPLKQLIIYGPPFPKNSPTAPELLARQPDDWDAECANLRQMMGVFASRKPGAKLPRHPAFGQLSRRAWGVLSYKHIDHHLKQFGV
jgi:Protein of unknown function (DUF1569)